MLKSLRIVHGFTSRIAQAYDIDLIPLRVYDEAETEYLDGVTLESVTLLQK